MSLDACHSSELARRPGSVTPVPVSFHALPEQRRNWQISPSVGWHPPYADGLTSRQGHLSLTEVELNLTFRGGV
jgi:hypothetical protein